MMVFTLLLALAKNCWCCNGKSRRLSLAQIAGYEPWTVVTDANAIDLDLQLIKGLIDDANNESDFEEAFDLYVNGGHSGPYAEFQLDNPLLNSLQDEERVVGRNGEGIEVVGLVLGNHSAGSGLLRVKYFVTETQDGYSRCLVGALRAQGLAIEDGCFAESGTISLDGSSINYSYNIERDNKNYITLSTIGDVEESAVPCSECKIFKKYWDYYGQGNYADIFVRGALQASRPFFTRVSFNFDTTFDARGAAATIGMVVLKTWMEVILQLEKSYNECSAGNDGRRAFDLARAFYTGSLEGKTGSDTGLLLHQLSDDLCQEFSTCGNGSDELTGRSYVNREVLNSFRRARPLFYKNQCSDILPHKENAEKLMIVPLIQGTLKHAWARAYDSDSPINQAQSAAFAASLVPLVNACSEKDAGDMMSQMRLGSNVPDFPAIKMALERNYDCLGVTCKHIGGLFNKTANVYLKEAEPCSSVAATICPEVPSTGCSICGDGRCISNGDGIFSFPGYPDVQCRFLQDYGYDGTIPLEQCPYLPQLVAAACDCVDAGLLGDTPRAPTPAASMSPLAAMPATAPAPVAPTLVDVNSPVRPSRAPTPWPTTSIWSRPTDPVRDDDIELLDISSTSLSRGTVVGISLAASVGIILALIVSLSFYARFRVRKQKNQKSDADGMEDDFQKSTSELA